MLTGRRLGVYQVEALIGAGGMGEVYRARDTRLGRDVAIKILPRVFTTEPDRLARFEREARILASLNHPNVGAIYGVEESVSSGDPDGHVLGLVLELVEGETLAERIRAGPLSARDALGIAKQIAEALEAAHAKGIVHRDLKPANIKVAPGGTVKVLDFGLAKAGGEAWAADSTHSPTVTAAGGGTGQGVILGTAAYMSPEQARGLAVDTRTDIWAFGCVLYETLTGTSPFHGDTTSDTIARILEREPDWRRLPSATPARCCVRASKRIPIGGRVISPASAKRSRPSWLHRSRYRSPSSSRSGGGCRGRHCDGPPLDWCLLVPRPASTCCAIAAHRCPCWRILSRSPTRREWRTTRPGRPTDGHSRTNQPRRKTGISG